MNRFALIVAILDACQTVELQIFESCCSCRLSGFSHLAI